MTVGHLRGIVLISIILIVKSGKLIVMTVHN